MCNKRTRARSLCSPVVKVFSYGASYSPISYVKELKFQTGCEGKMGFDMKCISAVFLENVQLLVVGC